MTTIKEIKDDWSRLFELTDEQAKNLLHIAGNPIYKDCVSMYGRDRVQDEKDPYTFRDVLYWLDYEANMDDAQNESPENRQYSRQATSAINRWLRKYYSVYASDPWRPWGCR